MTVLYVKQCGTGRLRRGLSAGVTDWRLFAARIARESGGRRMRTLRQSEAEAKLRSHVAQSFWIAVL
jgi:hypothetical protein